MAKNKEKSNTSKKPVDNSHFKLYKNEKDSKKEYIIYSDSDSALRRSDKTPSTTSITYETAEEVIAALSSASSNNENIIKASRSLYAINPTYRKLIAYLSNLYLCRYIVIPQILKTATINDKKWQESYDQMLSLVDGLSLEVKLPKILTQLWTEGGVYFTTFSDTIKNTVNLIILPNKYCKKVGESSFGTAMIKFDCSYFDSLGFTKQQIDEILKSFPPEMKKGYDSYKTSKVKWLLLSPTSSSCLLLNTWSIPTLFYTYGEILNYETYKSNELTKNSAQLETIFVHKIPTYQDQLILDIPEMQALHQRISKIVNTANKSKLITTIGDVSIKPVQEGETRENNVLLKAYKSIFANAGLNDSLFSGDSVASISASRAIDKSVVWNQIEEFVNFLNLAINSVIDFKGYQIEISMIPVSRDSYKEDLTILKDSASLGVGITNFIVASGIKQKNIDSYLVMEEHLNYVGRIKPLQSTYTVSDNNESTTETSPSKKEVLKDENSSSK